MVLKTKSCNLLTTPSRSSPRDAILRVFVDRTAPGEFGWKMKRTASRQEVTGWVPWKGVKRGTRSAGIVGYVTYISSNFNCEVEVRAVWPLEKDKPPRGQEFPLFTEPSSENYARLARTWSPRSISFRPRHHTTFSNPSLFSRTLET